MRFWKNSARTLKTTRLRRQNVEFGEKRAASQQTTDLQDTPAGASETISQQEHEIVQQFEKTLFYLKASQVGKGDDLAHDHKKHAGLRKSRNNIVRHLIDQATLDSPAGIKRHVKGTTIHSQEQPNRSNIEERFRIDTQVHHCKKWLRSHDQPQDTDFFRRFLADGQLPEHASRGLYEAKMRTAGNYSDEDMHLFQVAWRSMIAEDLE